METWNNVIICFYNEHWVTLWRTIYSIVTTSDGSIIEIILIDDGSDMPNLKENLVIAIARFNQINTVRIKLIRQNSRSGLIQGCPIKKNFNTKFFFKIWFFGKCFCVKNMVPTGQPWLDQKSNCRSSHGGWRYNVVSWFSHWMFTKLATSIKIRYLQWPPVM